MKSKETVFGTPPECPECGQPVEELSGRMGGYRRVHSWCANRRRETLRRLRDFERRQRIMDERVWTRRRLEDVGRILNHAIKERNATCLKADRSTLAWIKSDVRLTAYFMNLHPDMVRAAFQPPISEAGRVEAVAGEPLSEDEPISPLSPISVHDAGEPRADIGDISSRRVAVVHRVGVELGVDALDQIAGMVDWRGGRPWAADPTIAARGTIPTHYLGILPDPGRRTDFDDWTYDLDFQPPPIRLDRIIDGMWTHDAQTAERRPDQLRPYAKTPSGAASCRT